MNPGLQTPPIGVPVDTDGKVPAVASGLLLWVQQESPELAVQDAFVVPPWFSQQATWLQDPWNSDNRVYNYPLVLRIRGSLKEEILQKSLQEIVRRHHVLRSVFRQRNGELIQIVVPPPKQNLRLIDLSECPPAERDATTQRLSLEQAHEPFDLGRGPLLRSTLIRLGPDDHILHLTTHHIIHDDWSTGILVRELFQFYQSFAGEILSAPLSELSFHYGDYVRWHQKQFEKQTSRVHFWKHQLSSPGAFQHLRTDFDRPAAPSHRGAREGIELDAELADSLTELSRQERVSLFMVLLAGFQCLLHHYSGHDEIGIASCAANRPLQEVEGLIGRFGNDIFLRTSLSGNPTCRELLIRVRDSALTAYSDQNLPFGALLPNYPNEGEPNRKSPFQVMFILQNAPKYREQIPGLSVSWIPLYTGTAKYDLNVWLKINSGLEVILEYSTDLFRAATMKQILEDYHTVLGMMVKDPGTPVRDLLISTAKRESTPAQPIPGAKQMVAAADRVAPKDEVESRLVELWEAAFAKPIGLDQNFFELGGDSLLAARLFSQIEKAFQIELPLALLLEAPTIRQLAGIIGAPIRNSLHSSVVPVQPSGTKPPLFCIHGQTGEMFFSRHLSLSLGQDQPVFGLRSQGLGGEAPLSTVEEMALHYLKEMRSVQPQGPYFLAGYCFGGMIAYEIGRVLKTQGEEIGLLVMFNTPPPGSLKWWPVRPSYLVKHTARELKKLRTLKPREQLAGIRIKVIKFARIASGAFKGVLGNALAKSSIGIAERKSQRLLSVEQINVLAAKAYDPGPYAGRITFFLAKDDPTSLYATDPGRWMELAQDGIEVYTFGGGGKLPLRKAPDADVAEKLKYCLARAQTPQEKSTTMG
jgi:thioesterase domain-containing protein/acyl carrier protein